MTHFNRRTFIKQSTVVASSAFVIPHFNIIPSSAPLGKKILGHNNFTYRVDTEWGNLDPTQTPVNNCHEMVMDSKGRLVMITDETRNNIIIYDKKGRLVDTWGSEYPGGHGLTIFDEGGEDVLFICDPEVGQVDKTTIEGKVLMTLDTPHQLGIYKESDPYKPTETAVAPSGDIYVADGYGSQYIIQYDMNGKYVRHFGGKGDADDQFKTAHGVQVDLRDPNRFTLLCTSREHNSFKRFTLDGQYLSTIFLPGAYVCRPVIKDETLYAGVCWSRLKYLNQTDNSGFVTILDKDDKVVSNPGGTAPTYEDGELQLMLQTDPLFMHCHDVCVDDDDDLYVCQWNANKTYPIKLKRV